jgi:NADH:ubiquinone oxidoreductase subunit 5 (subunit L)/multisubunit Na+/H+ antiporter MnhA subunit
MTADWIGLAPGAPIAAAVLLALAGMSGRALAERTIGRIAQAALVVSLLSVVAAAAALVIHAGAPFDVRLGFWFHAGDYQFPLVFLVDPLSVWVGLTVSILLLATCRFSLNYLHREPGFMRFFILVLVFAAGFQLIVFGGSLDLLLAGWEVVGMTSVLLVGFFHERASPVRAAVRVLITYRLCDIGLLVAAVLLHIWTHSTVYADLHTPLPPEVVAPLGLCLVLAAMGKSAQFPVGGWLPRAMEGPTASSAVFYGGLSVHAGVYLLIRSAPIVEASALVRGTLILVGLLTSVMASLSARVSADAKTALAYATISQVGLMFVECGLGLFRLAALHLVAHALLRYYQFLRTPSTLQDALERQAALGLTASTPSAREWEGAGIGLRRFVYRLAMERFAVEAALERWVALPTLALGNWLDRVERRAATWLGDHDP